MDRPVTPTARHTQGHTAGADTASLPHPANAAASSDGTPDIQAASMAGGQPLADSDADFDPSSHGRRTAFTDRYTKPGTLDLDGLPDRPGKADPAQAAMPGGSGVMSAPKDPEDLRKLNNAKLVAYAEELLDEAYKIVYGDDGSD